MSKKKTSDPIVDLNQPLTLAAAFVVFEAYASEHTDDFTPGSVQATKSAVRQGVRSYAAGANIELLNREAVHDVNVVTILRDLPAYAARAAKERGQRTSDNRARARKFVEVLLGTKTPTGRHSRHQVPKEWQPLTEMADPLPRADAILLARCCHYLGFADAPIRMPLRHSLREAAAALGINPGTLNNAMRAYHARQDEADRLGFHVGRLTALAKPRTTHFAIEPEAIAILAARGVKFPEKMDTWAATKELAPQIAADVDYALTKGLTSELADSTQDQRRYSVSRAVGWLVRAGHADLLPTMRIFTLLEREETTRDAPCNERLASYHAEAGDLGRSGRVTVTVSLLEKLAEREAGPAVARTFVLSDGFKQEAAQWESLGPEERTKRVKFTAGLITDITRIWSVIKDVYGGMRQTDASTWNKIEENWTKLSARLWSNSIPAEHISKQKNKGLLVRTVTLPPFACVAMPLRLREIRWLQTAWLDALREAECKGHKCPEEHPAVKAAYDAYFGAAVPFCRLAVVVDDGLRYKQYVNGRLGDTAHFRPSFEKDEAGNIIGLSQVATFWYGDRRCKAGLKVRGANGKANKRENRLLRRAYTPHDILFDIITVWRPRQLVSNGAIPSLEAYDLVEDMKHGRWALFPTDDAAVQESHKPLSNLTEVFAKEFWSMIRRFLRPELPAYEERGSEWRGLLTQHIARLLNGSYHGGICQDWATATELLNDKKETIEKEYNECARGILDKIRGKTDHWEHPKAYDSWMKRMYHYHEDICPLDDPTLPLPDHLRDSLKLNPHFPVSAPKRVGRAMRRSRPGQAPPTTRRGRSRT